MDESNTHNLLVVSDMHMAEGLVAEAGERSHGYEAFLYDASFSRFLQYHERVKQDAALRVENYDRRKARHTHENNTTDQDEVLNRPWRLVLAGDTFDFWDMATPPGCLYELTEEIDKHIDMVGDNQNAIEWLEKWMNVFAEEEKKEGKIILKEIDDILDNLSKYKLLERSYLDIRRELDKLGLTNGAHRRSIENLAWWIDVLIHKPKFRLSNSETKHGLGTTWREVVWKLTRIYRGHREFFTALAWFIAHGNEVILLKGNHDLELYWPEVHNRHLPHILVDAYKDLLSGNPAGPSFDAFSVENTGKLINLNKFIKMLPEYASEQPNKPSKSQSKKTCNFIYQEWFHLEEDLVYIEHGNQYEPLDSSVYFLAPKLPLDANKIELPWGAHMARYVYNKIVAVHPFAVNIKPEEKIIHWMINQDLFRIIGILFTAFPDVVRGLLRAIQQGLRGKWIWGDRSALGLLPRLAYEVIQCLNPKAWNEDQKALDEQHEKIDDLVSSFYPSAEEPENEDRQDSPNDDVSDNSERIRAKTWLYISLLLHSGLLLSLGSLSVVGLYWLDGSDCPNFVFALLGIFTLVTLLVAFGGFIADNAEAQSALGQILLQLGGVGFTTGLILNIFLSEPLGWSNPQKFLVPVIPLIFFVIGSLMVKQSDDSWRRTLFPKRISGGWPALVLHSSASVFKELSLASFIASLYLFLKPRPGLVMMPWLLTSVSLFMAGWMVNRLHTLYISRLHVERVLNHWLATCKRIIRIIGTIFIVLAITALLIVILATSLSPVLEELPQYEQVHNFAQDITVFSTGSVLENVFVPRLVILISIIGIVILVETALHNFLRCLSDGRLHKYILKVEKRAPRLRIVGQDYDQLAKRQVFNDQLSAIQELAITEQQRFAASFLKLLNLVLPFLSFVVLVSALIGVGAAAASVLEIVDNVDIVGGLSIGGILGATYWILRQISASLQRHDPASGFGDLYHRMATNISRILSEDPRSEGTDKNGPRYYIFGHDHWADSKRIDEQPLVQLENSSAYQERWYVNSGTWLRGYVEEQRRQEVNENHSTFIQIFPGLDTNQAPRVLRWNDDANQPEHIIRRSEPLSAGRLFSKTWRRAWPRWLTWFIVFSAFSLLVGWVNPDLMTNLLPIFWALLLWIVVNKIKPISN